jgi:hypothetical protein
MGTPMEAQHGKRQLGERDVAVFVAFATLNVQLHAGTIDLGNLEIDSFPQAQATGVDQVQADPMMGQADQRQNALDLVHTQDDQQSVGFGRADKLQDRPGALEGLLSRNLRAHKVTVAVEREARLTLRR